MALERRARVNYLTFDVNSPSGIPAPSGEVRRFPYTTIENLKRLIAENELGEGDSIELCLRDFDIIALEFREYTGASILPTPYILDGVEVKYTEDRRVKQHTAVIERGTSEAAPRYVPLSRFPSATELKYRSEQRRKSWR